MNNSRFLITDFYSAVLKRTEDPATFAEQLETFGVVIATAVCRKLSDPTGSGNCYSHVYRNMMCDIQREHRMTADVGMIIETATYSDGADVKQAAIVAILEVLDILEKKGDGIDFEKPFTVRRPRRRTVSDITAAKFDDVLTNGMKEVFRRTSAAARKSPAIEGTTKYNYIEQYITDDKAGGTQDTFYMRTRAAAALNGKTVKYSGAHDYILPDEESLDKYYELVSVLASDDIDRTILQHVVNGYTVEKAAQAAGLSYGKAAGRLYRMQHIAASPVELNDKVEFLKHVDEIFYELETEYNFPKHGSFGEMSTVERRQYKSVCNTFFRGLPVEIRKSFWSMYESKSDILREFGGLSESWSEKQNRKQKAKA